MISTPRPRLLIVEDDQGLRSALATGLEAEGFEVLARPDGTDVREAARGFDPWLAVLDVRIAQGPSGLTIAQLLREDRPELPLLFLTAADGLEDRLAGFRVGADDYVVKPVALAELAARVRALLRRSARQEDSEVLRIGELQVDEGARTVHRNGEPVELTRTEFDLLTALGRHQGRVLSKAQLLTLVWGFEDYDPNLVEVYISTLRRKLEARGSRLIQTVRGVGYTLRP